MNTTDKPPKIEIRKTKLSLKCHFTEAEVLQLGKDLAQASANAAAIEDELKTVTAQVKAKLAEQEAQVASNTSKIQSGFEYRQVDCEVRLGDPKPTKKTIIRLDTNAVVEVRDLSSEEHQYMLKLEQEEAQSK